MDLSFTYLYFQSEMITYLALQRPEQTQAVYIRDVRAPGSQGREGRYARRWSWTPARWLYLTGGCCGRKQTSHSVLTDEQLVHHPGSDEKPRINDLG